MYIIIGDQLIAYYCHELMYTKMLFVDHQTTLPNLPGLVHMCITQQSMITFTEGVVVDSCKNDLLGEDDLEAS